MARLIVKNGYLKAGGQHAPHIKSLVGYIATRDGVQKMQSGQMLPQTKKQQRFIKQLLTDFKNCKDIHEYHDYLEHPTRENASALIEATLEYNLHKLEGKQKYLDYIANRPRVEKFDTHGLFSCGNEKIVLSKVQQELANHQGNIWTPILSLKREDATRLNMDNAATWQTLLQSKAVELASSMKINPENFRWYAAYHDEGHHPHVHMICYSTNPKEGYLNHRGIEQMKSMLANTIFQSDLALFYQEKTAYRDQTKQQARAWLHQLLDEMKHTTPQNKQTFLLIEHLSKRLQATTGKKQYGYLKPELKNIVDQIVDELAKEPIVAQSYQLWQEQQQNIVQTYTDTPFKQLPLSQCEPFRSIKNMIIQEVLQMDQQSYQSEQSTVLLAGKLLGQIAKLFEDHTQAQATPTQQIDRKRRQQLLQKKRAIGQKPDDHENQIKMN